MFIYSLYSSSSRALTFPVFLIKQMGLPLMLLVFLLGPSTAIPISGHRVNNADYSFHKSPLPAQLHPGKKGRWMNPWCGSGSHAGIQGVVACLPLCVQKPSVLTYDEQTLDVRPCECVNMEITGCEMSFEFPKV